MADAAEADAEAVRAAATEVLLLDHDGHNHEALARARDLMLAHQDLAVTHRLLGELHYAAAVRAAHGDGTADARKAAAAPHLRVARDALAAARRLAPDCVDIAAALGDAFAASRMFKEAEVEYLRARRIPQPSDPALHNASYGMFEGYEHERDPDFASERVEEARDRARASYARMTVEELVPIAIHRVLEAGRQLGAADGRKRAKLVAETFPNLGRAQYLAAYMDLEFVRSLDAAIDKRPFLRRTLVITERAARDYPKSAVIASFHAKLLFVLGEYDAAETECRRALEMEPDDPQQDCIPVGSISGDNRGTRLVSLACEFHELINKILILASDYWDSMSTEWQRNSFLQVRFDVLQDEYLKVDRSYAFTMSDVRSFVKEHKSWRFWICPLCDRKKFTDTGLLLSHMCSRHPRAVLPRLQSVLDQKLSDEALESDDSLDGVTFCEDSEQQDMVICFNKSSEVFKWLFYAPSSGVRPKPFPEIREKKCEKGRMLLESIKDKMKTLPADRSTTERELKKCMTEDPELASKSISAADIDAIFTKELVNPASNAVELTSFIMVAVMFMTKGESSENPRKNTESPDPAISVVESETDLAAKLESEVHVEHESSDSPASRNDLDEKTDPKLSDNNKESGVELEGETSKATVTGAESSGQPTNTAEGGSDLDTKLEKLQIGPGSDRWIVDSDAGSSGRNGGGQHQQE
ncbi:unnamed protein product [Miscanthus lutarioriparius]|uniref:DUF629 domain-containing protein n=1 Tax=Miscanthus lutarioriparius TaxID=422564 RepID=A0A811QB76_9POAL|nr:unnamed protein product [Miscanthus lutarioriparius]